MLFAGTLTAQQTTQQPPDYTRPTLLRILTVDQPDQPERRVEFPFGAVQIEGRNTRWLIGYLPFLMPLSGSVNTGRGLGSNFPDPFALTHTEIAYTSRTWRDSRAMSREMRRIESEEKKRAKVKVNPE
ncbi:MAG TPA: hypothetical protein VF381_11890 [Thermoanaerobaculia bacterium]